jgi:hypothetical protein
MASQIQLRRDTAANWTTANTVLAQGEAGLETDTNKVKLGDGVTAWTSLAYFANSFTASQISDLTASAAELNILDGATLTTTELNYVDGVTSAIQTQLDAKAATADVVSKTNGTVTTADTASTVVRNITLSTADPTGGIDGDVWLKYTA